MLTSKININIKIKLIEVFCNTDEHNNMKTEISNTEAENPSRKFFPEKF